MSKDKGRESIRNKRDVIFDQPEQSNNAYYLLLHGLPSHTSRMVLFDALSHLVIAIIMIIILISVLVRLVDIIIQP